MSFTSAPNFGNNGPAGAPTNGLDGGVLSSQGAGGGTPQSNFQAQLGGQGNAGFTQQDYSNALAQALQNQLTASQQQQQLIANLQAQANGTGVDLAQTQLQNATQQNLQNTASQIGSIQGINPADQARLISQNQAGIQQNAAGQSAVEQQQTQFLAQQQLAQALASNFAGNQGLLQGAQAGNAQNLQNYQYAEGLNQETGSQNAGAATTGQGQQAQLSAATNPTQLFASAFGGLANGLGGALGKAAFSEGGMVGGPETPPGVDGTPAMLKAGEMVVPEEIVKLGPLAVAAYTSRLHKLTRKAA